MYILALVFCLRGDPASCRPPVYPDMEPVTLMACVVSGQQAAAQLLATEPDLQGYALAGHAASRLTRRVSKGHDWRGDGQAVAWAQAPTAVHGVSLIVGSATLALVHTGSVVPLYLPEAVWAMHDTLDLPGHALPRPHRSRTTVRPCLGRLHHGVPRGRRLPHGSRLPTTPRSRRPAPGARAWPTRRACRAC